MPYQQMLDNFFSSQRPLFSLSNRVWNPPTDIFEEGKLTHIRMEIAGLDESAMQLVVQRNVLIIRGRRDQEHTGTRENMNYHLLEVHYGEFERAFAFSFTLQEDKIKARYERGFLIVEVERTQPVVTKVSVEIIEPGA